MINAGLLRLSNRVARPAGKSPVILVAYEGMAQPTDGFLARVLELRNVVQVVAAGVEGPVKSHATRTGLDLADEVQNPAQARTPRRLLVGVHRSQGVFFVPLVYGRQVLADR